MAEGESLKIAAQGPPGFSFDVFVYEATTHDLIGRSDADSRAPDFEWTAPKAGRYLIVLRNVSSVDGTGIVSILHASEKGINGPEPPQTEDHTPEGNLATPGGNLAIVEIPYATDRELMGVDTKKDVQANKYKLIQTYGVEPVRDDTLQYGVAKISIPRAHRMGELEGASILRLEFSEDQQKHIVLQEVTSKTAKEFEQTIAERMKSSPNHDVLVFVHGFNTSFEDALRRAGQIKYDLGFSGATILYSWPSHGKTLAYNSDGRNAELSIPHFRAFVTQLAAIEGVKTIHVVAHSMGNRVVMHALAENPKKVHLHNIALMAPDVDAAVFRQLAVSMKSTADQITLYASSKDGALIASEQFGGYSRAGEGGTKLVIMPGVMESIDASTVDTSLLGLSHSYFADNGTILSDLFRLLQGDLAGKRFGLVAAGTAGKKYWILAARAR